MNFYNKILMLKSLFLFEKSCKKVSKNTYNYTKVCYNVTKEKNGVGGC